MKCTCVSLAELATWIKKKVTTRCLGEKEAAKRQLVTECHEWLCAHNGVDRTLAILTQNYSRDMAAEAWPNMRNDVLSGATDQKMDERHISGDNITLRVTSIKVCISLF